MTGWPKPAVPEGCGVVVGGATVVVVVVVVVVGGGFVVVVVDRGFVVVVVGGGFVVVVVVPEGNDLTLCSFFPMYPADAGVPVSVADIETISANPSAVASSSIRRRRIAIISPPDP
jgi:hypothetical protein